jgi:DNA-binding response OmpR family regulator
MQIEKEKPTQKDEAQNPNRVKILIVDDDPELRAALKLRLRANHYETVSASDGYSAIALAQKERPNLIILDLGLPAGNGFIVLKRLQENDALSHIPVIVLTARDPQGNELRSLDSGATAFFQKPADNNELLQVIRASLRSASAWGTTLPS